MTRVVASIEARMGSSRFPGKVMEDVHGRTAIMRVVDRLKLCERLDDIIVATTTDEKDDFLVEHLESEGVKTFRGSEDDVLQRVVDAHRMMKSDVIVEITGDATCTDPIVVDVAVQNYGQNDHAVVTTCRKRSYPLGIDAQVFSFENLEWVSKNIPDDPVHEHVSLYFYENPDKYHLHHLVAPVLSHAPDLRFVLDYPEDLIVIKEVYGRLEPKYGIQFGTEEIVALMRAEPGIAKINADCYDKPLR